MNKKIKDIVVSVLFLIIIIGFFVINILKKDFIAKSPNTKWFTNITYLKFSDKTLYLSAIMDGFNGKIVAYKFADIKKYH